MQEIIDKSITIFNSSGEKDFLPVKNINNIFYFTRENNSYNIEDVQKNIDFLSPEFNIQSNIINMNKKIHEEIKKEILEKSEGKNNLVFSENAYLSKEMVDLISNMSFNSKLLILIALRNPYDVFIPNIKHGICTYGFNKNVLLSLSKILKGKLKPTGSLPIKTTEV
jgi:beta-N-acetylhexosaminidase